MKTGSSEDEKGEQRFLVTNQQCFSSCSLESPEREGGNLLLSSLGSLHFSQRRFVCMYQQGTYRTVKRLNNNIQLYLHPISALLRHFMLLRVDLPPHYHQSSMHVASIQSYSYFISLLINQLLERSHHINRIVAVTGVSLARSSNLEFNFVLTEKFGKNCTWRS